jgi:hypothetical protein
LNARAVTIKMTIKDNAVSFTLVKGERAL